MPTLFDRSSAKEDGGARSTIFQTLISFGHNCDRSNLLIRWRSRTRTGIPRLFSTRKISKPDKI